MSEPEATVGTTDAELDGILERMRLDPEPDPPAAMSATYDGSLDLILIRLDDGQRLAIPRERMQGLESATPEQLAHIEIFGDDIAWPDLDVDHYLPHLLKGKYASERWKQARRQQEVAA